MAEKEKVSRATTSLPPISPALHRPRHPRHRRGLSLPSPLRRPLTAAHLRPPSPQVTEAKKKLLEAKTKAMEMKAKVMQGVTPAQMRADRKAMYEMVCKQVRPSIPSHTLGLTLGPEPGVRWHASTCAASPCCSVWQPDLLNDPLLIAGP